MGIDKPDIRTIIHYGPPSTLEEYYQQTGRAGRDGLPSNCILFYEPSDFSRMGNMFQKEWQSEEKRTERSKMASQMASYAATTKCRQQFIVDYFGEQAVACENCDNCNNVEDKKDFTQDCILLLQATKDTGGRFGLAMPIDVLRGSKAKKILEKGFHLAPSHGLGKAHSKEWWNALAKMLIQEGYLHEKVQDIYKVYSLSQKGTRLLEAQGREHVVLQPSVEMRSEQEKEARFARPKVETNDGSPQKTTSKFGDTTVENLHSLLLKLCYQQAQARSVAPYMILGGPVLEKLALFRPTTIEKFRAIEGVDEQKALDLGPIFTELIKDYCMEHSLKTNIDPKPTVINIEDEDQRPSGKRKRDAMDGVKMTPAKSEVYNMFQHQKKSIQEIARLRGCQEATVEGYLATAFECGLELDWDRLGIKEYVFNLVSNAFQSFPPSSYYQGTTLKAIKDSMPQVSYGVIQLVRSAICTAQQPLSHTEFSQQTNSQNPTPVHHKPSPPRMPQRSQSATQVSPQRPKPQPTLQRSSSATLSPQRPATSNSQQPSQTSSMPRRLPANFKPRPPVPSLVAVPPTQPKPRPTQQTEESKSWIPIKRLKLQTPVFVRHKGNSIARPAEAEEREEEEDDFLSSPSSLPSDLYDAPSDDMFPTQRAFNVTASQSSLRVVPPAVKEFKKNPIANVASKPVHVISSTTGNTVSDQPMPDAAVQDNRLTRANVMSFILSKREKGARMIELYQRFPENKSIEVDSLVSDMEQEYLLFKKDDAFLLL